MSRHDNQTLADIVACIGGRGLACVSSAARQRQPAITLSNRNPLRVLTDEVLKDPGSTPLQNWGPFSICGGITQA
jgi:hypothetical protein